MDRQTKNEFTTIAIIGNGFDLNLGLKTGYNDFISSDEFKNLLNDNNYLADHLLKVHNLQNWVDIENQLTFYSKNAGTTEAINSYQDNFKAISNALKDYLKKIKLDDLNTNSHSYKLLQLLKDKDFLIYDFNYTKSAETILMNLRLSDEEIKKRLIKVHGSLEEDDIIFGIEDSATIRNNHVFLRKAYNPSFKGVNMNERLKRLHELHIFGHSLGQTDHMYFKKYFESFTNPGTHANPIYIIPKIYLYHYGDEAYNKLFMQLDTLTNRNLSTMKQESIFIPIDTSK